MPPSQIQRGGRPIGSSVAFSPAAFNGFEFADLTKSFPSVSVDPATNVPGFSASDVTLSAGDIFVNLQDLSIIGPFNPGPNSATEIILDIPALVPEPGSLGLLGIGLLGFGAIRWRRKLVAET